MLRIVVGVTNSSRDLRSTWLICGGVANASGLAAIRARKFWVYAAVGLTLVAFIVVSDVALTSPPTQRQNPIQHVIVVMQENRTFDNYFWTWPGQAGYVAGLCMPLDPSVPTGGCVKPKPASSTALSGDLPHSWTSSWAAYNNGSMNGFLTAAGDNPAVMDYYDNGSLPNLWTYAKDYVLADQFFTSAKSYSQPNHWYMIAGASPQVSLYQGSAQEKSACYDAVTRQLTMATCAYINQAQEIQTMADLMNGHGITWKYYDTPIPQGATLAAAIKGSCKGCDPWAYWNPLDAKNSSYTNLAYTDNIVARRQLFWDIGNGTLPQVSWVIPSAPISDHPPANITLGMWWITDIVDSVMQSKYWQSTAIVVLWDDYGGFFDTVSPPAVDGYGLSFRTPALIISPYAKEGYLDHTVYDFESTLKFIEWRFGLPSLTQRDSGANDLLNAFDFNGGPGVAHIIPLTNAQLAAIQPYVLLGSNSNPNPGGSGAATLAFIDGNPD
jgi:phospholipase C